MRHPAILLLLAGSASAAFQLPFLTNLWPSVPKLELDDPSPSNRIAIVGAGAAGSSAAFWIAKAKERFGFDVEVDIYDKNSYVGGRSTTVHPYDDLSYEPVELGASIFVKINKNLWRATEDFNLSRYDFEHDEGETGFWDGEEFIFTQGGTRGIFGSVLDNLKIIWRYGYFAPLKAYKIVKGMTDKFVSLYTLDTPKWENITELVHTLDWDPLVSQTGGEYFTANGVSKKFTYELIEAATLVNYAQDMDSIHALEAACSLAAAGASSVKGGNWQIFQEFVHRSGANVFLDTEVNSISRKSATDARWTLRSDKGQTDYRGVILAAPYHTADVSLPADLLDAVPPQPYVHLHVTLLTTTAPTPNATYFGLTHGAKAPTTVLTTLEGMRNGKRAPEFNSLNYLGKLEKVPTTEAEGEPAAGGEPGVEAVVGAALEEEEQEVEKILETVEEPAPAPELAKDEWVVKIFSLAPLSDEWLSNMFEGQVGWVLRQEWDAYPVLPPTNTFPPIKLDRGLFYVNAFEPFISTMETETIAARNIVEWLLKEEFDAGLCPPAAENATANKGDTKDFVYGWDC